jgi:hypothetical protein
MNRKQPARQKIASNPHTIEAIIETPKGSRHKILARCVPDHAQEPLQKVAQVKHGA